MSDGEHESGGADPPPEPEWERGRNTRVVLPPAGDGDPDLGPFGGSWLRGGLILLLVLVPVALYAVWSRGLIDLRDAPVLEGFFDRERPAAADTAAGTSNSETPVRDRFRRLADSLDVVLGVYENRRSDAPGGGAECETLGTSFEQVEDYFSELSLLHGENRARLGFDLTRRYESLLAEVDSVRRHFERSGCEEGP